MKTHTIGYTEHALGDLEKIYGWIARDSPTNAEAMIRRITTSIDRLASMPRTGRPAVEQDRIIYELRQLSVRPYRVLYTIQNTRIVILRVRHSAQDDLTPEELQDAPPDHHA